MIIKLKGVKKFGIFYYYPLNTEANNIFRLTKRKAFRKEDLDILKELNLPFQILGETGVEKITTY